MQSDTGAIIGVAANVGVDELCAHCEHPCKPARHYSEADRAALDSLCRHAADVKLFPNQRNISSSVVLAAPTIVFTPPGPGETPEKIMAKTKEIFENLDYPDRYALTPKGSLDDLYKGPKVSDNLDDLYKGPTVPPKNEMTETQKLEADHIRLFKDQRERVFKTRELVFEEERVKEELKQEAELKVHARLKRMADLEKEASS